MPLQKTCKQCGQKFTIDDPTLEFIKKISPIFDGQKFEIPPNDFCEECRHIRRMLWRNETHLYRRKCDLCKKDILSTYRPDSSHTVYCLQCWWGDDWDAGSFGVDYNPNLKFIDQFNELLKKVPQPALIVTNSINCDYCSNTVASKNCYMCFSTRGEDCMYGRKMVDCRDTVDCLFATECEKCYQLVFCENCFDCKYLHNCRGCRSSMYLFDCVNCHDCFMCSNQRDKSFMIRNKQLTKDEFLAEMLKEDFGSRSHSEQLYKEFVDMIKHSIHRENRNYNAENCTGDHLTNCKNCQNCFEVLEGEDSMRVYDSMGDPSANNFDCDQIPGAQLCYESLSSYPIFHSAFCSLIYSGKDAYYSVNCFNNCEAIFGCVGLKHSKNAVLNKEYSSDEYERIVSQIIESMIKSGDWGDFFSPDICPYAYNESIVNDYWPKTKTEAKKLGYSWNDDEYGLKFDGKFYTPLDDIKDYYKNAQARKDLLDGVLQCQASKRPFKITSQELAYYIKNDIPIPITNYFARHKERMKFRNPRELFERKCDNCSKMMHTSYAPNRPEKVYCENCYQKAVL